jgi:hypothetical protein
MNHLTDEQLSAHLDGALPERERAASDAHLAGCDACRARLVALSELDASLGRALTHDPGEAYFADFADRVAARIAAEGGARSAAAASGSAPRSAWGWLLSPRGLSLAGGTAALMLVAGLAWMRFQRHDDVASALRDQAPSLGTSELQRAAPPESPPSTPAPESARSMAALDEATPPATTPPARPLVTPPAGTSRAREVRTTPQGEERSVQVVAPRGIASSGGSRLDQREQSSSDATAKLPVAEMKRRALVLAQQKDLAAQSKAEAGAPAPAAAKSSLRAPMANEPQANAVARPEFASELESTCGTVHDTRGQPIAAAQIVAVGADARNARTGADGRFCLPSLRVGDTLSVLRVGYDPVRIVVTPATSLAIRLEPVGTLSPESGSLAFGKTQGSPPPSLTEGDETSKLGFTRRPPVGHRFAPEADVYAAQPVTIRVAVAEARQVTAQARRDRTASSYERAADRWERIGGLTAGQASWDARFQGLAALREAQRLTPTSARATRLRARLNAFLAIVPETLPERTTVLRWQAEMESNPR